MGTGLLAPFYRAGLMPQSLARVAEQLSRRVNRGREERQLSTTEGLAIKDRGGVISPTTHVSAEQRSLVAMAYAYRARAECALDVVSIYPGGDYLEFGSTGLATFRSFLGAFYLHHGDEKFVDTRFYAFDIFGNPDQGSGPPGGEQKYFEGHRTSFESSAPIASLAAYGALAARCTIVPGYFQDTLNDSLKAKMQEEKRKIGFVYIDVNLGPSYKVIFDFLIDIIGSYRMYLYLDEYFVDTEPPTHILYEQFASEAKRRYGLNGLYMRNSAGSGALFALVPHRS